MSNFSGQDMAQVQVYLVGGAVRDRLLGLPVKDRDYVVVGATPELMIARGFKPVGLDFPVFLHPQTGEEYALARTERKTGHGYHGFSVLFSPDVSLEQDLFRRDLTINAMAENSDGVIIDPYHGQRDINRKRLRHVSDAFCEDPLRVLRLLRFHAKLAPLGFQIDQETWRFAKQMVTQGELEHLTVERVWLEVTKALATDKPSVFFKDLYELNAMNVLGLKNRPPIERFHQMQSTLALVSGNSEVPALRFAAWLAPYVQGVAQIAKTMPLPRTYQYWLDLFANHAPTLRHWLHASPLAQWQVFKQSGSLRKTGDIVEFAHALGCDQTIITQINAKQHQLQAIEPQTFIEQGLQGKALGEAIKSAQLNQLTD